MNGRKIGSLVEFSTYHNQHKIKLWEVIRMNKK